MEWSCRSRLFVLPSLLGEQGVRSTCWDVLTAALSEAMIRPPVLPFGVVASFVLALPAHNRCVYVLTLCVLFGYGSGSSAGF